jgi:hypothetical protein
MDIYAISTYVFPKVQDYHHHINGWERFSHGYTQFLRVSTFTYSLRVLIVGRFLMRVLFSGFSTNDQCKKDAA